MRSRRPLLALIPLLAAVGCQPGAEDVEASDAAHTEGDYVHSEANPFYWDKSAPHSELSYPDEDLSSVLPASEPITARMQAWADRIHGLVKEKVRAGGGTLLAPRPILKVLPTAKTFNAWVSGTVVCIGKPFKGSYADPAAGYTLLGSDHHIPVGYEELGTCRTPTQWPGLDELLEHWNDEEPSCDLTLEGNALSSSCYGPSTGDTALVTTSPFVHFTSLLLASVDEKTAVTILAHELGHYYRAHTSSFVRHKYRFWYEGDPKLPGRPVPSSRAAELDRSYRNVFAAPKDIHIDGAIYGGRLRRTLAAFALQLTLSSKPGHVCAPAVGHVDGWASALASPTNFALTPRMTESYLAFERELERCAPRLKLASGKTTEDTFPLESLHSAIAAGGYDATDPTLQSPATFDQVLTALTDLASEADAQEQRMLEELREGRIGLYTTEQEADDVALDITTKLGVTPGEVLGAWLKFMKAGDDLYGAPRGDVGNGDLGYARCKELYDAGFMETGPDGEKRPVQMTLGNIEASHHGSCYRLYNLWRENNAHGYEPHGTFEPPAGPTWEELAAKAASMSGLGKTAPPETRSPPEDVPPAVPSDYEPEASPGSEGAGEAEGGEVITRTSTSGCGVATSPSGSASGGLGLALAVALLASRRRTRDGAGSRQNA